jgi:hypothetical protein
VARRARRRRPCRRPSGVDELDRAKDLIEHHVGAPAHHFAHPKADSLRRGLNRVRYRSSVG